MAIVINLQVGGLGALNAQGGSGGGSTTSPRSATRGPFAALHAAQQAYATAADPASQFDAAYRLLQAQQRFQRAQTALSGGGGAMQAWKGVLLGSRFGMGGGGGGLMPNVGQTLGALSKLGPFGIALGVATAALVGFVRVTVSARDALQGFAGGRVASGGSFRNSGQMALLGSFAGMSPSDMAGLAQSFSETLASGGIASGLFRLNGIKDRGGFYGNLDKAGNLNQAIRLIATMQDAGMARRMARAGGLDSFLQLRDASPAVRDRFLSSMATLETQSSARALADFNIEMANFKVVLAGVAKQLAPILEKGAKLIGGAAQTADAFLSGNLPLGPLGALLSLTKGGGSGTLSSGGAIERNTRALEANTRELRESREVIGGGTRARSAVPSGWRYEMLDQAMRTSARNLGGL